MKNIKPQFLMYYKLNGKEENKAVFGNSLKNMAEKKFLKFEDDLMIWDSSFIRLIGVKHGLLTGQSITEQLENASFVFIISKNSQIRINEIPYQVKTNYLFHVAADKRIIIDAQATETEYFIATYYAAWLPDIGREIIEKISRNNPFRQCWGRRMRDPAFFYSRFTKVMDLLHDKTILSRIELTALFYAIIHRFYEECISERESVSDIDYFAYASQYLQRSFAENVSIQNLADTLGVTRSTLYERFRHECGIGPQKYLMQLRLEAACKALKETSLSIDEIATSCGLRDKTYFSRVFKTKYGTAPGKYRNQSLHRSKQCSHLSRKMLLAFPDKNESSVLIENMGRLHRFHGIPSRVVCLDYCAAEMCVALGTADKLSGVASAESYLADCRERYRNTIANIPLIPAQNSNGLPDFSAVCSYKPELVIGTGYSFHRHSGIADANEFEQKGIHVYATIASYMPCCGFESIYEDLRNLGKIFDREPQATELIREMATKATEMRKLTAQNNPNIRVFVFDSAVADKALTCGRTLENYMISSAGGINIFENKVSMFTAVEWSEVAAADPQVILVHSFYSAEDGWQKIAFLKRIRELANTSAIQNDSFIPVGIKKVFPSIDCVDTAYEWFQIFCGLK